jgi:acyl-coenzyme A synthetase/AMP-(fatty) acid ligase
MVIPENRNTYSICKLIFDHKVTVLPTSPTFLNMLLLSEDYKRFDLSSLKLITYGSEPIQESLLKRLKEVFKVKFHQTFGISELGVLSTKSEDGTFITLNEEYKIENNELIIKKRPFMIGYLNAENDNNDWYHTGDIVEEKKIIRIIGRKTDIINVGGHKVNPSEVESVLFEISEIKDCSVYGTKYPILGQIVSADIVTDYSYLQIKKIITEHCKQRLDKYAIPIQINIKKELKVSERFKKVK